MKTKLLNSKQQNIMYAMHNLVIAVLFLFTIANTHLFAEGGSNSPKISLSPTAKTITETDSAQTINLTINIDECPNLFDITIRYRTNPGSAHDNTDYTPVNATHTFPASSSCTKTFTFPVTIKGDTAFESDEAFTVTIATSGDTGGQSFTFGNKKTTVTIKDNDVNPEADLGITKTANKTKVNVGDTITYTIIATNHGPHDSQIKIEDQLSKVDFENISIGDVTYPKSTLNCAVNNQKLTCTSKQSFSKGDSVTVKVKAKVKTNKNSSIKNTTKVKSNDNQPDSNTKNNSALAKVTVNRVDLKINKDVKRGSKWKNDATAVTGDTIKFRLIIGNYNDHPSMIKVTDTLPPGMTLTKVTLNNNTPSNFHCSKNIPSNKIECTGSHIFHKGDKATIYIEAKALSYEGRYYNTAYIESPEGYTENRTGNNRSSVYLDINQQGGGNEGVTGIKTITPVDDGTHTYYVGDTVTYTLTATNHGQVARIMIRDWLSRNGSTSGAFEFVSINAADPSKTTCSSKGGTGKYRRGECISNSTVADGEQIGMLLTLKLKKAGDVCNRGYFYKEYQDSTGSRWFNRDNFTVCITVQTPKQPPVLNAANFNITVGVPANIRLKNYTTDPDTPKGQLTYSNVQGLPAGLSMNNDGEITGTYTGDAPKTFTVTGTTVTDEVGLTDTDDFTITVKLPKIAAHHNTYEIPFGTVLNGNMLLDHNPDEGIELNVTSITYRSSSTLPDGNLTWSQDGTFTYTAPMQAGTVNYRYDIEDKYSQVDHDTLKIIVYQPEITAKDDSFVIAKNIFATGNVLEDNGNGIDIGDSIEVVDHSDPQHGTLDLDADGSFVFTPEQDYSGSDQFEYTIRDSYGQEDNATVSFDIGTVSIEGYTDFQLVNPPITRNIIGDYLTTGNTVECITNKEGSDTEENSYSGSCQSASDLSNNDWMVRYIDVDGNSTDIGKTTWNSSSAKFTLPDTYEQGDGEGIAWAGLFWQGSVNNRPTGNKKQRRAKKDGASYVYDDINSSTSIILSNTDANKVLLNIGNGSSYQEIESNTFYYDLAHGQFGGYYAAFANITTLMQDANLSKGTHTMTIANITTNEGREVNVGNYGGWSLVVIFKEDVYEGTPKNISIYNGYQAIGFGGSTNVAKKELKIKGFKLPLKGDVNSKISAFVGEGEEKYGGSAIVYDKMYINDLHGNKYDMPTSDPNNIFDATLTNIARATGSNNDIANTNGIDIDSYDVSTEMQTIRDRNPKISEINIGIISKDNDTSDGDDSDYVTASMLAFSAELYIPKLCYDYSYKQDGIVFSEDNNGTQKPYITGDRLRTSEPVTVELHVRNEESSDAILTNVTLDVVDINITQATYSNGSTWVTYPNNFKAVNISEGDLNSSNAYVKDIPLKTIDSLDTLYINYDLNLLKTSIHMPLDARLNFTLNIFDAGSYDLSYYLETMPVCGNDRYAYFPVYDMFNIQDAGSNGAFYDLPTQIVKRVGNYTINAYNNDLHTPKSVTTMVAVELIDAGKYHDVNASCFEPDNSLSPRVWIAFDNAEKVDFNKDSIQNAIDNDRTSVQIAGGSITNASEIFKLARQNVAFRISYPSLNDENRSLMHIIKTGSTWEIENLSETRNTYGDCNATCKAGSSLTEIAQCLECLYGENTRLVCSRDNFSLRPKGFRMLLSDQNTSDPNDIKTDPITTNNSTKTWNLVAGYSYRLDINATNYVDDSSTSGYFGYFDKDADDANRSFGFKWHDSNPSGCLDTSDANSTAQFINGMANLNINHDQIGIYELSILDKLYTQVDWKPEYMKHQQTNYFKHGTDCIENRSTVLIESDITSFSSSADLGNVNGCDIASNVWSDPLFLDLKAKLYPYSFNLTGINVTRGPNNKSFIYIDTPSTSDTENTNMSYNFIGTYYASAYTSGGSATHQVSNFTTSCWSADTVMTLGFDYYNNEQPAVTPFLGYSLKNTGNGSQFRPASGLETDDQNSAFISNLTQTQIEQKSTDYVDEMTGAITMDLGYNFKRQNNLPLEPRLITFNDFNISYTNTAQPGELFAEMTDTYKIKGNLSLSNTPVTFLYGRAKPSKTLYDNITSLSANTPISVVAYCSLGLTECQNRGFALMDAQTSEANWWLNRSHVMSDNDGNIVIKISSGYASPNHTSVNMSSSDAGTDSSVLITRNSTATLPMTAVIDLDNGTNKWLIYNPLNAFTNPSPFYRVRFIGTGNWAGHGDTGHVVGGTVNKKKNQRLGW